MSGPKYEQLSEDDVKSLAPVPAPPSNVRAAETKALVSELAAAIAGDGKADAKRRTDATDTETKGLLAGEPAAATSKPFVRPVSKPSPQQMVKAKNEASTLTVRKTILWIFITVCVVAIFAILLMRHEDTADRDQEAAAMTLDFRAMCDSKAPFTFATRDLRTNRSLVFYVEGDVEIVDMIQAGQVTYTESVDFADRTVIVYPKGRSLVAKHPCTVQTTDREKSWREIVCKELSSQASDRLVLDDHQMAMAQQPTIMRPVPANFFNAKPQDCAGTSAPPQEDATQKADDQQVVAFRNMTADHTLRPQMITTLLELLSKEHGGDYVQADSLQTSLGTAFDRSLSAYSNSSVWTRAAVITNSTSDSDICCGLNQKCRRVMSDPRSALPVLCSGYADCVRREHSVRSCNDHQQSCECSSDFAAHLMQPGNSRCGDCKTDPKACECYAALWLQTHALSQRTCSCQGMCVRAHFPFVCETTKTCSGWWDIKCETTVHWCVRSEAFPCVRCNMVPHQATPRSEAEMPLLCWGGRTDV